MSTTSYDEADDLRSANKLLHGLVTGHDAEIERLRGQILRLENSERGALEEAGQRGRRALEAERENARLRARLTRAEATLVQAGILNASGGRPDVEIDRAIREYAVEQSGEKS